MNSNVSERDWLFIYQQVMGEWAENGKEYAHSDCIGLQTTEWEEATDNDKYSYLVG